MVASAEPGLGMSFYPRHLTSALFMYQSSVSLLPAFLILFLDGSVNFSIASKPRPPWLGLGMRSSSSSSSSKAWSSDCCTLGSELYLLPLSEVLSSGSSSVKAPKLLWMACQAVLPLVCQALLLFEGVDGYWAYTHNISFHILDRYQPRTGHPGSCTHLTVIHLETEVAMVLPAWSACACCEVLAATLAVIFAAFAVALTALWAHCFSADCLFHPILVLSCPE